MLWCEKDVASLYQLSDSVRGGGEEVGRDVTPEPVPGYPCSCAHTHTHYMNTDNNISATSSRCRFFFSFFLFLLGKTSRARHVEKEKKVWIGAGLLSLVTVRHVFVLEHRLVRVTDSSRIVQYSTAVRRAKWTGSLFHFFFSAVLRFFCSTVLYTSCS